ncbi:MAG: hypothetical protein H7Z72_00360 [Bacteroidetes bacterium]|nr:hypothetical protein [Fibrella sp.]
MIHLYKKYVRLSCHHASYLLAKRGDAPLTVAERWRLAWHLRLCDPCTRFGQQVRLLDKLLTRNLSGGLVRSAPTLRPDRRAAMNDEIKKRLNA